jgi:hypothetical protein
VDGLDGPKPFTANAVARETLVQTRLRSLWDRAREQQTQRSRVASLEAGEPNVDLVGDADLDGTAVALLDEVQRPPRCVTAYIRAPLANSGSNPLGASGRRILLQGRHFLAFLLRDVFA